MFQLSSLPHGVSQTTSTRVLNQTSEAMSMGIYDYKPGILPQVEVR